MSFRDDEETARRAGLVWTFAVVALAGLSVGLVVAASVLGAFGGTVAR